MWPKTVTKADLKITFVRGDGKGGQKRNKTSTKCRMVHIPTGISTECDETRHQHENKKIAFQKLAKLLIPLMLGESKKERFQAGEDRVRTYVEKTGLVHDDRSPEKTYRYDNVLTGNGLDDIITDVTTNETLNKIK